MRTSDIRSARRPHRGAAIGVVTTLVVLPLVLAAGVSSASAITATGGDGRYVESVQWLSWGTDRQQIPDVGVSRTESFTVGGLAVDVTCTIADVVGTNATAGNRLEAYRPGNWQGDALDQLYNIGGTDGANTLVNGLANRIFDDDVSFDFSCSAMAAGNPFPLAGLVVGDAEQIDGFESISAKGPAGSTWRVIDRYRTPGCTADGYVGSVSADNTLRLANPSGDVCNAGPAAVSFLEGGTSADVSFTGTGYSAIALGVLLTTDRGDAPASYGDAAHLVQSGWTGGTLDATPRSLFDGFTLASTTQPALRLGASTDSENAPQYSAGADGDDLASADGTDDEDSYAPVTATVLPGGGYSSTAIACAGGGAVASWIDWNRDGDFADSGERSSTATCASGTATVSWTVPAGVVASPASAPTFQRIRTGATAADIANPTGFGGNGETEDYPLQVAITAPAPVADQATTPTGTPVTVSPLDNDAYAATLDPSRLRLIDPATSADATTVTIAGEGVYTLDVAARTVTFTPASGFAGTSTLGYRVFDRYGQSAASTIAITVGAAPAPVAGRPDPAQGVAGRPLVIDPLGNDSAVSGGALDPATLRLVAPTGVAGVSVSADGRSLTVPGEGTYVVDPSTGRVTFTPTSGFSGSATPIGYTVQNADGATVSATITVTIVAAPAAPAAPVAAAGLASTGADVAAPAIAAGLLLLTGAALGLIARRRHTS